MPKQSDNKGAKTNGMRALEAHGIEYTAHYYPAERRSAGEVAEMIGAEPAEVYKTLVVLPESGKGRPLLVLVPATAELDLKLLAKKPQVGEKKLRMATQREAESLTGLLVGGISPLALLQKGFRVFIDKSALAFERVYLSGGQRGVNLRVAVADLLKVTGAQPVEAARPVEE